MAKKQTKKQTEEQLLELRKQVSNLSLAFEDHVRKSDEFLNKMISEISEDRLVVANELMQFKELINRESFVGWFLRLFRNKGEKK